MEASYSRIWRGVSPKTRECSGVDRAILLLCSCLVADSTWLLGSVACFWEDGAG